jgi:hypothetical protein
MAMRKRAAHETRVQRLRQIEIGDELLLARSDVVLATQHRAADEGLGC